MPCSARKTGRQPRELEQNDCVFNAADQMTQGSWQHGVIEDYTYDGDSLSIKEIDADPSIFTDGS